MSGSTPDAQPIPETEQEKALAEVTKSQWNHYTTDLRPLEDRWMANMRMDEGDKSKVAGETAAGIGTKFDEAQAGMERGMFSKNIDPSSGKFTGAMAGLTKDRTKTVGAGTTKASQGVDDATVKNLQNAVGIGRGQSLEATAGMGALAENAQREAVFNSNLQLRKNQVDQDQSETLGATTASAAGFGLSKWKMPDVKGGVKPAGT